MNGIESVLMLIGRIFVCAFFLWAAAEKIMNWQGTCNYMKSKKVPFVSYVMPVSLGLQIVGGLSLLFGYHTHFGALLLLIYTVPAAYKFHDFWNVQGAERNADKVLFMKDLVIIGALLILLAIGGGHIAISK